MNRVQGKVVLVTGAARGIGAAAVGRLQEEGATVVAADIDATEGKAIAAKHDADFYCLDVSKGSDWQQVVGQIISTHGRIDGLVNNAGVIHVGDPVSMNVDEWRRMFAVNVDGVMFGCKTVLPHMIANGQGSIVNMSSIGAGSGLYFYAGYCATKGAVAAYTKSVAVYCAQNKLNVRCNSIHPGGINTPLNVRLEAELAERASSMRIPVTSPVAPTGPKMRYGEPDDIAWLVVYLVSNESQFMNGAELDVDNSASITAAVVA